MWIRVFRWTVIIVVVGVGIAGLYVSGSPGQERARKLDEQRVNDLENITQGIDQYWNMNQTLPKSLEELQAERNVYIDSIVDPESGEAYIYERTSDTAYQLCANFTTETVQDIRPASISGTRFWTHNIGKTCFPLKPLQADTLKPTVVR